MPFLSLLHDKRGGKSKPTTANVWWGDRAVSEMAGEGIIFNKRTLQNKEGAITEQAIARIDLPAEHHVQLAPLVQIVEALKIAL
jgi:hypothetical protein